MKKKTGFIAIIGRPSTGKSTLLNKICGYKISIVSKHPQTTRFLIRGIFNDDESQLVFVDTPGYHNFDSFLNKGLTNLAVQNITDCDLIVYLLDNTRPIGVEEREIAAKLQKSKEQVIVAVNKVDVKPEIDPEIKDFIEAHFSGSDLITLSATEGKNVDILLDTIKDKLPVDFIYYPEEYVTDQSIPFRIEEVVREKVFIHTSEEIPHDTYVKVIDLNVGKKKIVCHCNIYVNRNSQKGIVVGNKGKSIKKIGEQARLELEDILETKVDVFLHVKLHKNWKKDEIFIKKMYKFD